MQPSIFASIFYMIALISFAIGLYAVKKTENKLYGAAWLPLCFIAVMCFQTFTAAVIDLVTVSVNIWTVGAVDIIAAAFLWYKIIRGRQRQRYIYMERRILVYLSCY